MTWTLFPANEFSAHAERWQTLNCESVASPLLNPEFVQPLLAEFGSGNELLACYERDGRPLAMAIMTRRRTGVWQSFQPSQAPVGIWMHRPGLDMAALMSELMRTLPGFPLMLAVTQKDPLLTRRPPDSAVLRSLDYVQTARITIRGSFEEYWDARGKNLRTNLKKQRAKLDKEGIATRMQVSRSPREVAEAIADYGRLESAGWKAGTRTAIHPDNAQGRFYRAMMEGFCRLGQGSILRYWFGDQLVAMNLCIEGHDRLIVLKTTYDESLSSHFSPAFLMREETCRQMFEEQKFNTLEFYGKVMEWHLRWTDEVRTLYHVNNYRWPALLQLHTMANNRAALFARLRARPPVPAGAARQGQPSTE